MKECLQKQIEQCHNVLNRLSGRLDNLAEVYGNGSAETSAALGKFYLTATKLLHLSGWGSYKPTPVQSPPSPS
jgi:hypothetical protein